MHSARDRQFSINNMYCTIADKDDNDDNDDDDLDQQDNSLHHHHSERKYSNHKYLSRPPTF